MPESWWGNAIFSLVPTIVLGLIFWMVMRMIIRGDRTARREYDRVEAEERIKMGLPPRGTAAASVTDASADEALQARRPEDLRHGEPPAG
ncbi:hypothetical protein [Agrococcus sp. ARC_14]|uniref:hypothetical protein n=1 Tax=Agrococcus sp. ARC_14 TaxID=2919927 RepID=UPI001F056749|nr:hypothetical protein [Agrococcus sp. ARC_14]MCH1884097.1 hypothetical protein [Agrococcus sp. ARC_14]